MNTDVSVEIPNKLSGFRKLQKGRKSSRKQENQDSCLIKEAREFQMSNVMSNVKRGQKNTRV